MANEIGVIHTTGATVTAKVLYLDNTTGWTQQGSDVSLTEDGTIAGHYAGNMPTASAGRYYISFYDGGTLIDGKTTAIDWDGTAVITGNSIDTVIDGIKTKTDSLTFTGSDINATLDGETVTVSSINTNTITADSIATDAVTEIQSGLSTFDPATDTVATVGTVTGSVGSVSGVTFPSNFSALGINASGHISRVTLVDSNTDMRGTDNALLAASYTAPDNATISAIDTAIGDIQGTTFNASTDSLEAIRNRGDSAWITATGFSTFDATSEAVRISALSVDDIWDEPISGHLTAGTTGATLNGAGSAGDPWATALPGAYSAGTAGNIVGNNLDATVSSRLADADYTAPDNASITSILEDTGTTIPAQITAAQSSIESGQFDPAVTPVEIATSAIGATDGTNAAELVDLIWNEILTGAYPNGSAGKLLRLASGGILVGDVVSATSTTVVLNGDASTTDDIYNKEKIEIIDGTGAGQSRYITDYVGSTKTVTISEPWTVNPDNTSIYKVSGTDAYIHDLDSNALAQVNSEVDTAISDADIPAATWATNFNELTAIPGGSTTVENMIKLVYLLTRNRITQTSTTTTVYADDGSTAVGTATITDDGTTTVRGELG